MNILQAIALAAAATQLLQTYIPIIRDQINGGELTPETEAQARAEYEKLRAAGGQSFSGPEYELSGR